LEIKLNGGICSAGTNILFSLTGITGSVYYNNYTFIDWPGTGASISAQTLTNVFVNQVDANQPFASQIDLFNPFLTKMKVGITGGAGTTYSGFSRFKVDSSVSSTGFTLAPSSGTLTGGTITVYGYRNS
jgi:hypothetical protein